jgi:hypothetical protein
MSPGPHIVEGDFAAFFAAPFAVYGRDAYLASPLEGDLRAAFDPARNPLLQHGRARLTWFTAHRDGAVVGRVVAVVHDASNRLHGWKRGTFGMLDCIDDVAVAGALLEACATWTRARGCDELIGNFNLTITQMIGTLTEGFEHRPYTYQDWSPPYLPALLAGNGFVPTYPMRTFEIDVDGVRPGALLGDRQRALLVDPDWEFAPIRRWRLDASLRAACAVLNDGFADNPMFVPLSEEEFLFPSQGMALVMDDRLSCIARHRGEPVGVLLCLPDLNPLLHALRYRLGWSAPWHFLRHRRPRRAAIVFYSVRRDWHSRGVNGVMLDRVFAGLRAGGYAQLGVSWISDGNHASLRQMAKLGARPLHRLHLFRKALA